MPGYNELLRRIEPEKILCYHTPFPEMQGDIIYVDYERSSWRHLREERAIRPADLEPYKVVGQSCRSYDTMSVYMDIHPHDARTTEPVDLVSYKAGGQNCRPYDTMSAYMDIPVRKGGGSVHGGNWRPNPKKPEDSRYIGEPGEIKTTFKDGYRIDTKIGVDGKAILERHYTDHNRAHSGHTNPHDHIINWSIPDEHPLPGPPINYKNGAPEFEDVVEALESKNTAEEFNNTSGGSEDVGEQDSITESKYFKGVYHVKRTIVPANTPEQNRFVTISDFKQCINWGGEVEFAWKGIRYGVMRYGINNKITIYTVGRPETDTVCETADEALEYIVGGDRLRDVITSVTVLARTI